MAPPTARRKIDAAERRARLAARHRLAAPAPDVAAAAGALVGLHSSDPVSVYLSAWSRVRGFQVAHLEDALYAERSLVRLLGMRRTMFVVPRDLAAVLDAACTRALVAAERRRLLALIGESQYRWAATAAWLDGDRPDPEPEPEAARAELVRRWLAAFGPGTLRDVAWWTGWSQRLTRDALASAGAVEVDLDAGAGFVLAGDLEPVPPPPAWAALLPALDPTVMGWKERSWYLGGHQDRLFDRNGNAGPTVWADGRVVGGWAQRPDGRVVVELLEAVPPAARDRIEAEAERLRRWLAGTVIVPRFRTPLERRLTSTA